MLGNDRYLFNPMVTAVKIVDSNQLFPVSRVFCIGRNYPKHAAEMESMTTKEPFFFMKPHNSVCQVNSIHMPDNTKELHHEVELVVCLKKGGRDIAKDNVKTHIFGYAVGIDLTKRDIQDELKKTKKPWELSKAFDFAAPISKIKKLENIIFDDKKILLKVNGIERQAGNISEMVHKVDELISYISNNITLHPGDLIFTGTPSGVNQLNSGDYVEAEIEDIGRLDININ